MITKRDTNAAQKFLDWWLLKPTNTKTSAKEFLTRSPSAQLGIYLVWLTAYNIGISISRGFLYLYIIDNDKVPTSDRLALTSFIGVVIEDVIYLDEQKIDNLTSYEIWELAIKRGIAILNNINTI